MLGSTSEERPMMRLILFLATPTLVYVALGVLRRALF